VDFPYLYYRFACGEQIATNTRYREGITSRHLLGDLKEFGLGAFSERPDAGADLSRPASRH